MSNVLKDNTLSTFSPHQFLIHNNKNETKFWLNFKSDCVDLIRFIVKIQIQIVLHFLETEF